MASAWPCSFLNSCFGTQETCVRKAKTHGRVSVGVPANSPRLTQPSVKTLEPSGDSVPQPLSLPSNVHRILEQGQAISAVPCRNSGSEIAYALCQ